MEGNSSAAKHEEEEKVDTPEASGPSAVQSPGAEGSIDFVKYTCDTRKTAMKEGNIITISSVTHARVRIDGFTSGRNMLGKQNILCSNEGLTQHTAAIKHNHFTVPKLQRTLSTQLIRPNVCRHSPTDAAPQFL